MTNKSFTIQDINKIAVDAGKAILEVYSTAFEDTIQLKDDESPLTKADLASHKVIIKGLESISNYPIISEESTIPDFDERKYFKKYWLIDPLDGTKEFIKRNGEFTVNIALIENNAAILGCVYVPVTGDLYWGEKGKGAFKKNEGTTGKLKVNAFSGREKGIKVVSSRSFLNQDTKEYINRFDEPVLVPRGSSLKLMMIAEGDADFYPRLGPTMEWDIAAAQIILEEAGGKVLQFENNEPLVYNKENLLNPYFIAFGEMIGS